MPKDYQITVVGCHKQVDLVEGCENLLRYCEEPDAVNEFGLTIEHEPDNQYDPNALRVKFQGKPIGYVSKDSYVTLWEDYPFDERPMAIRWELKFIKWTADEKIQWLDFTSLGNKRDCRDGDEEGHYEMEVMLGTTHPND